MLLLIMWLKSETIETFVLYHSRSKQYIVPLIIGATQEKEKRKKKKKTMEITFLFVDRHTLSLIVMFSSSENKNISSFFFYFRLLLFHPFFFYFFPLFHTDPFYFISFLLFFWLYIVYTLNPFDIFMQTRTHSFTFSLTHPLWHGVKIGFLSLSLFHTYT